jgi:hypothetical protein
MLEMSVTIATADDANRAAAVFASIALAYAGEAPATGSAPRTRRNKPNGTAALDPVAVYIEAGGKFPDDLRAEIAADAAGVELPPDRFAALPAAEVAVRRAETTIAQEVAQVETAAAATPPPPAPSASFDEKCVKLRALGRPHGVTWLRAVMKGNKVERISDLPESKIDEIIADLERGAAN